MIHIAQELCAPYIPSTKDEGLPIYARIHVDQDDQIKAFMEVWRQGATPVLVKDALEIHISRFDNAYFISVINEYIKMGYILRDAGVKRVVLAADADSLWQKVLSPRYLNQDLLHRQTPFLQLFQTMQKIIDDVVVLLTVEELAPGGMDATDGIFIAQSLERLGLKEIIATSGTKDFMPLYDRRDTRKKHDAPDFLSNEPGLACALWLRQYTGLMVSCAAFVDDPTNALHLGQSLGLTSIIKRVLP